jgi:hypothetical protein
MGEIFLIAIAFYILYKLVFELIAPVYRTTTHLKRQFRDMHENMQRPPQDFEQGPKGPPKKENSDTLGEYIDFEEVKEKNKR